MIYFDNSATAPIDHEVYEAMLPYLQEEYGNPSSKYYCKAINAKKAVEDARANLKEAVSDLERNVQSKSGKDYSKKSDVVIEKQVILANAMTERLKAMKSILTEEQYAKYIVFENNFAGQLQKMLMEHKQKKNDNDK